MEPRLQRRKEQLLAGCQVPPTSFRGVISRLESFAQPVVAALPGPESRRHSHTSLAGLLADLEREDAAAIASRDDLDRQASQRFIGEVDGDHEPRVDELIRRVATAVGRPDAVSAFDPAAFPKKGTSSVGVQRRRCGRLGQVENRPVGVSLGYVSDGEHAPVDSRLDPPREWAHAKKRRKTGGVPKGVRYRARDELAPEMPERHASVPPHGGVAGDGARGRPAWSRRRLAGDKRRYFPAVPSAATIRDLEEPPPEYGGQGRRPEARFRGVRSRCEALPAGARAKLSVRDGEKGPPEVEAVARRVESKVDRRVVGFEEAPVAVRYTDGGLLEHDYHLSDADPATPLSELARVAEASHRIAACLKRSESEAGLGESRVRNRRGWDHPMALSSIATWFLVVEARRGKEDRSGVDGAAGSDGAGADPAPGRPRRGAGPSGAGEDAAAGTERVGAILSLQGT